MAITWDKDLIKSRIATSNAWVARAIWVLADAATSIRMPTPEMEQQAKDDAKFFQNLRDFFKDNGFFTDRHIAVARNKIRDPYYDYLALAANK
jgi:hypothetical protein